MQVALLVFGSFLFIIFMGAFVQKHHLKDLDYFEKELAYLPVTTLKQLPPDMGRRPKYVEMVHGSCVIGPSLFNLIMRVPSMIFGGQVRDYAKVAERARREAIYRLKKQAREADIVINLKVETIQMEITENNNESIYAIQVLAYGTAITY